MSRYRIAPKITHEILDGEVIAIHFDTGAYYSLRGTAAVLWKAVADGKSTPAFSGADDSAAEKVDAFLRSLVEEGLLEVCDGEADAPEADALAAAPFEMPVFERFDDMRELLLADPIHEVDASGWPNIAP